MSNGASETAVLTEEPELLTPAAALFPHARCHNRIAGRRIAGRCGEFCSLAAEC